MIHWLQALLPGAQHVQNIHPLIVHFPIVFLMSAALLYALAYGLRQDPWAKAAFGLLLAGHFRFKHPVYIRVKIFARFWDWERLIIQGDKEGLKM